VIRGFVEVMGNAGPSRMEMLHREGTVEGYYVLVGPDREAGENNVRQWRDAGVPKWAWYVCGSDQDEDLARITELEERLDPVGWCLDIEKPLEGAKLQTLIAGVSAFGKQVVASLAAITASHVNYDYRCLDRFKVAIDWQAYFDSGEGSTPAVAVQELYQSSFVIPGWEYRTAFAGKYGWGKAMRVEAEQRCLIDLYQRPGPINGYFAVAPRQWGWTVVSRSLLDVTGQAAGVLMGRAAYTNIRVTLDVTRTAEARPAAEWTPIAASARAHGANRRPVSVYLVERTSNEVLRAIAAGGG